MMGHKEKMVSGDEFDALTRAKKYYLWRSRIRSAIKRRFNKRIRRNGKMFVKEIEK